MWGEGVVDIWHDLTKAALHIISDAQHTRPELDPDAIVEATLGRFAEVAEARQYRARLIAFVEDVTHEYGWRARGPDRRAR